MDRDKVIKGLEMCISPNECSPDDCPYYIRPNNDRRLCGDRLMTDALILLNEQEVKEQISDAIHETAKNFRQTIVRCKDCVNCIKEPNGELYCDVLAIGYEPLGSKKVTEDWFCADGEREENAHCNSSENPNT